MQSGIQIEMKETNQHIVFLTPGFAESEHDSTSIPALQVFLKSIRNALPNATLTLLTFQFPFKKETYIWNGIKVISLNGRNSRLKKLWTWKKAITLLEKLHKTQKIDTVHSFWIGECSRIGQKFSKKHNINHVVTVMGQDAVIKNIHAKTLRNTNSKIITLSSNHQTTLLKTHQLNSTIIPWHLHIGEFTDLQESTIDIIGVGSLNAVKNYSDFIDVISIVAKTHKNLKVAIIGEGILQEEIAAKIKKLQLEDTIKLTGELPRVEVLKKMSQSAILLHTSSYESFGFVFLEALYAGMQIVSYDVGLAKETDYWSVGKNTEELAKACSMFLSNKIQKKRITLSTETETVNAYLSLYNA